MRLVIVGYGPGGVAAAVAAHTFEPSTDICILTHETTPSHRRPGVTLALTDPATQQLYIEDWSPERLARRGIEIRSGVNVVDGDVSTHSLQAVTDRGDMSVEYDRLILATGGEPVLPNIPGVTQKGVFTIQTLTDARRASESIEDCHTAVVVGAGLSALEVAERLLTLGKTVHLVVRSRLMRRLLEPVMSEYLCDRLPDQLKIHQGTEPSRVMGSGRVEGVMIGSEHLKAEAVFMMTGVRPNTYLAQRLGLRLGRLGGILVNQTMETSVQGIYAVGDCVEMHDSLSGEPILMPTASAAARGGRQAGVSAVGSRHIYDDTSLRFQYDRVFGTEVICAGHSSETSTSVNVRSSVIYDEEPTDSMKIALVLSQSGQLIGGQVISSRMAGSIGYQIFQRIRDGAVLEERPLLKSKHTNIKALLERTLGPIR